jgi:hypothetical protein
MDRLMGLGISARSRQVITPHSLQKIFYYNATLPSLACCAFATISSSSAQSVTTTLTKYRSLYTVLECSKFFVANILLDILYMNDNAFAVCHALTP